MYNDFNLTAIGTASNPNVLLETVTITYQPVPEPSSFAMAGVGLAGMGWAPGFGSVDAPSKSAKTRQGSDGLTTDLMDDRPGPMGRMVLTVTGPKVRRDDAIAGQNAFVVREQRTQPR
jgi:hypothetical protein